MYHLRIKYTHPTWRLSPRVMVVGWLVMYGEDGRDVKKNSMTSFTFFLKVLALVWAWAWAWAYARAFAFHVHAKDKHFQGQQACNKGCKSWGLVDRWGGV